MKTILQQAAQGDVLLRRIDRLPEEAEPTATRIVTHSETGHHHVALGAASIYSHPTDPLIGWLVAEEVVTVEHQRPHDTHAPLKLAAGVWEIRRQSEYTPQGWQQVID